MPLAPQLDLGCWEEIRGGRRKVQEQSRALANMQDYLCVCVCVCVCVVNTHYNIMIMEGGEFMGGCHFVPFIFPILRVPFQGASLVIHWLKTLHFHCKGHGFNPWLVN